MGHSLIGQLDITTRKLFCWHCPTSFLVADVALFEAPPADEDVEAALEDAFDIAITDLLTY